jgi:hypothetical protein
MEMCANLPVHAAALVFPSLPAEQYRELVNSVREHGLLNKISIWRDPRDNAILIVDGVHRARALKELGIELCRDGEPDPSVTEFWGCGADEIGPRVVAANLARRHIPDARTRIALTVAALEAGQKFIAPTPPSNVRVPGGSKRRTLVSQVAEASGLSPQTIYAHRDLLPANAIRTSAEIADEITDALANPESLPDPPRRNNHGGGKRKTLEGRVALAVGVATSTVQRHIERSNNGNGFNQGNGHRKAPTKCVPQEPEQLNDDDRAAAQAAKLLESICGLDVSAAGLKHVRRCEQALRRIVIEAATGELAVTPDMITHPAHTVA